ncbi:MAG TPA: thioredoxin domain-containing protein [Pyrinomonadaceae bacterium]|nr:thioredoxin domain-containing protein [Pyrinomonadaceae bacterium]
MQAQKKYTNRLADETSPYLLQHAHNPVDWYPWGDEAFEKAKAEDKPVLVSIGYSACHWCHVMEHESFEDEATARIMNEHFVNIKVDMEERPDVDQIYMTFVQLTTGRGGWPMNVFLTPERLPFFGGTYFPPVSRFNMPSFSQVLLSVAEAYRDKRDELLHSANDILGEMRRVGISEFHPGGLSLEQLDSAFENMSRSFDGTNGGFGGAPKFPPSMTLEFLLRYHHRTGKQRALEMVERTCRKMADGGIYDQLGGGFHRYSVDAVWLVPHFEKMLYDNAQLIRVYLHLYQITKQALGSGKPPANAGGTDTVEEFYKRVAVETLEYVRREMFDASGGFYSTQDADSEGVEGKFFVWTPKEIVEILGQEDAQVFNFYYDVSEEGNFEEKNILNVRYAPAEAAQALKIDEKKLNEVLERGRKKLFEAREKRIKPFRDEKILTAWNGLMLAAFAEASAVLDNAEYLDIAKRNAEFLLTELQHDGRLLRTWKNGTAKLNGYLEDYANLADGLIELYQASGEIRYLTEAKRLANLMIDEFWDEENGGFFFTASDHEELIVRNKDYYDNATPSGNSVAADVLLKLSKFFADEKYERFAATVLRLVATQISRYPQGFGRALSSLEFHLNPAKEIVIIGQEGNELAKAVGQTYVPNAVILRSNDPEAESGIIPLFKDRHSTDGKPTAYVCENFVCQRPVTELKEFLSQI